MAFINLTALSNATTVASGLSNLALVVPQILRGQVQGDITPQIINDRAFESHHVPQSFFFHVKEEELMNLRSSITDHYVEDNEAINDHIAVAPETFKVSGFVGDVNDVLPREATALRTIAEKLAVLDPYVPAVSGTANRLFRFFDQFEQIRETVNTTAVQAWDALNARVNVNEISGNESPAELRSINQSNNQSKQQSAFGLFYSYWRRKTLFTVQTPWALFRNMAIEHLTAEQDKHTENVTNFTISFKLIRFVRSTVPQTAPTGRAASQLASLVNRGNSTPVRVDRNVASLFA